MIGKRLLLGAWLLSATSLGCVDRGPETLNFDNVPRDFMFAREASKDRQVLPHREMISQSAWYGDLSGYEPRSEVFMTLYRGAAEVEEAEAARDEQAGRYGNPESIDYGEVSWVNIAGQVSWAWLETRYDERGEVRSLDYKAVVPFDSVTWVLEFGTNARNRLHPDSLIGVVHSFGADSQN